MKVLWLCNNAPGVVRSALSGKQESQVNWLDHVLQDLLNQGITLRILYRGSGVPGQIDGRCSYAPVPETPAHIYRTELEEEFRQQLRTFQPDVIHSWGVEYHHALAMVNAAEKEGMLPRMAASIQGLCCRIAPHYTDGIPASALRSRTIRDIMRHDSILAQQKQYTQRGELEIEALRKLTHVIGRTDWDQANALNINPNITYHHCDETLRDVFYTDQWAYSRCRKHRIFASSCAYPVKGFHILLEALAIVRKEYPDTEIAVTGRSFLAGDIKSLARQNGYEKYLRHLVKRNRLDGAVHFLGHLSAQDMKQAYLDANVFVLCSTMENSPNALGEAMLLGLPCVAAEVGGVSSLIGSQEGILCAPVNPAAMAEGICRVFSMENQAEAMGAAARTRARKTHDPEQNMKDLMDIYRLLSGKER
ncbi:MAG: glycosyltransferase family 4 protein [Clostridiales bacterium]|nr:glycosyltransferase family 4 protein [Clostridiales bacterium]